MKLLFLSLLLITGAPGQTPTAAIRLNQVGYLPGEPKAAIVATGEPAREFRVRRAADSRVVFRGGAPALPTTPIRGGRVQLADFTGLRQPGRYFLEVPGVGQSWEFEIGPRVYERALYLAMRSFYGQRCGTAVDLAPDFPGYRYGACHREGAWHECSGRSGPAPSAKGWHDADDYGRYIVNSSIATGTLLWAFELYRKQTENLRLHIPESGNQSPDFLDEIRWNLEWMLTMQDADGGVWHKQTTEKFAGFVMPDADTMTSFIIGTGSPPYKSTCATADFAAVMAMAARTHARHDADFARRARSAAESAWRWARQNPSVLFANPRGVSTGAYGDRDCSDELLWAAAELLRTTRGQEYEKYFLENWEKMRPAIAPDRPPAWPQVAPLAL
jgi:endoglucanase